MRSATSFCKENGKVGGGLGFEVSGSSAWQSFDRQATRYGKPSAVWVQICIFADPGATYDELKQLIANAREHAAPGATIYITGQPFMTPARIVFSRVRKVQSSRMASLSRLQRIPHRR
jgi:hypothetical protein